MFCRYAINKYDEGFVIDVELSICIPFEGNMLCLPNGNTIHVIENGHVPLCKIGIDDLGGKHNFYSNKYVMELNN